MAERILIVEDERAVARGLQYALEREGFQVLLAGTAREGSAMAREQMPDLIILDIRLPDGNGFDLCRELRRSLRQPILMLTACDDEVDRVLGLELGADDYVTKPYSLRELIARLRALLRRAYGELSRPNPSERIVFGHIALDLEARRAYRDGKDVGLTATEFKLLAHLAAHPGRIFSRQDLLQAVWGYPDYYGDERTVDVHIRHLREKVEDDPTNPMHLCTVRGLGYSLEL
ncbi:MAG TPA: response regulator transcription factor [Anaerolineae bacterium]|nr:response regulator transcription factor [Anaerolineae bacterium]HOR00463.1 response regulator transcription factor [Anaerolineae bacterium]HPL28408.1 response regulator transcription factor [Anaerolineae bacterium]